MLVEEKKTRKHESQRIVLGILGVIPYFLAKNMIMHRILGGKLF